MKCTKALLLSCESGGSDEDVGVAVDGPGGGVGDDVSWEDARRWKRFGHLSRINCNLLEGFVDMAETMAPCEAV